MNTCPLPLIASPSSPRNGKPNGAEAHAPKGKLVDGKTPLTQMDDLFRCFMDGIPDRIYFKDKHSRFIRANKALATLFGLEDPKDLIGRTDFDVHSLEHASAAFADEQEVIRSGRPLLNKEECETWPDREDTWVSTCKLPLRDPKGNIVGIFGISRDITEHKRAQDQIQEQARLLDLVAEAILVLDLEGHIKFWNQGAEKIYGRKATETMGRTFQEIVFHGIISPQLQEIIPTVMKCREWAGELETADRDGNAVVVQARANLVSDTQGHFKEILMVITDITERKKLETQVFRAQRTESLGTLASGIAHDLNNILSPLLIAVQLLKDQVVGKEEQKLLQTVASCAERGANLVKQVLSFSRGIRGERLLVPVENLLQEISQIISETFPKSIIFKYLCEENLWSVTGDVTQLHQVLLNLCVNARDAMPNGGKLLVRAENLEIDELYAREHLDFKPGRYVVIKVMDTGIGMSKQIQDKIFEPFFTTKGPSKGTGLGLSTCQAIVKSHGGFINCYSEPGKGCVFKVYLPVGTAVKQPKLSSKPSPDGTVICGHDELVLVVDDEESIRELAQLTLERSGYRVVAAANGEEALVTYQQHRDEIAAVLMDISMPIMDGEAAITVLKSINPTLKIIVSSGLDFRPNAMGDTGFEHRHFLPKPYSADTLLQALHTILAEN